MQKRSDPAPPARELTAKTLLFRQRLHQTAVGDDLLDEGRERLGLEGLAGSLIGDDAGIKIHTDRIACADGVHGLGAFHDGQADVDAVAVEDAREALGDDDRDSGGLDGQRCVLTGGAAAEVPAAHHDVAVLDVVDEVLVNVLHAVAGQLSGILRVQVAGRDDDVGIHVIRVFENRTSCVHAHAPFGSDRARVGDVAGQGAGGGGGGRGQIDLTVHMTHASHKVAVGGGNAALARCQNAHVATQTGAAGGGGYDAARIDKGGGPAPQDALLINSHGGGDDDAAHALGDVLALEDVVGGFHVL